MKKPPRPGTVFIHTGCPDSPCIVQEIVVGPFEIIRLDIRGMSTAWGSIEDWHDELRRGSIRVVYSPKRRYRIRPKNLK